MKNIFTFFAIAIVVLAGCSSSEAKKSHQEEANKPKLSIWLPEWQLKSTVENIENSAEGLQSLRVFGAYFNAQDQPFLTETAEKIHKHMYDNFRDSHSILLTFINDYVVEGKPSVQKDSTLLHRLVKDEQARKKHIDDIIALTEKFPVDGVEIDYEKIAKEDTANYILFLQELYEVLQKRGLSMHVVLVPSFPFENPLPDGPSYTVMAYNVHGYHSGPGAKATFAFLDQLLVKMGKSNQHFSIAFATGGFTWPKNGKIIALTGDEAEKLIASTKSATKRDKDSHAVYFQYSDKGMDYEAWYADAETLQKWITYVQEKDAKYEHFVLWRAGGLSAGAVEWIATHENKE
ncbi:glycosyl hydrolase family 18 protein [Metasolibacillus sp. FSL H7-0170]|uniref:glycosyl hydrolase family 18 protein n=1 Tax=Metasolibacillus TaxID=2703677 RepID=UPI000D3336C1|nr:glycosyl hydrolase family 18 protein [Metasolibacillus fluoroglycofenilyticus]